MARNSRFPSFTPGPRFKTTFRALKHRNYKLWFFGQGVSLIGTWMQSIAQQVLVYNLTGSAISLGIVNLMTFLPLLPFLSGVARLQTVALNGKYYSLRNHSC